MPKAMQVAIKRSGTFPVGFPGDNPFGHSREQCGMRGQTYTLNYEVRIVGDDQHLNERGFIIDNNAIHEYFLRTYRYAEHFPSCEQIACQACKDFEKMQGKGDLKNVKFHEIDVTISAMPHAGLTASWRAPKPRTRTVARR